MSFNSTLYLSRRSALKAGVLAGAVPFITTATQAHRATPQATADVETVLDQITQQIESGMADASVPGVALGIISGGERSTFTFGVSDAETQEPVTPATIFRVGSL